MHIHMSKLTSETFDPKPAVDLWMQTADRRLNQGGRSNPSSSSSTNPAMDMVVELDTDESSDSSEEEDVQLA